VPVTSSSELLQQRAVTAGARPAVHGSSTGAPGHRLYTEISGSSASIPQRAHPSGRVVRQDVPYARVAGDQQPPAPARCAVKTLLRMRHL
jgi:hypothetical protein